MNYLVFYFSLLFVFCETSQASVLSDLAQSMEPRSWVQLPENESLTNLPMHYSLLYYADGGVWDSVNKKALWIGGPGTCCANPADYKLIVYDSEVDSWEVLDTPYSGSGHAYDGNAYDYRSGLLYFAKMNDKVVRTWNGSSWGTLPEIPFSASIAGLAYFPEANANSGALVYVGPSARVAAYHGGSWADISTDNTSWGTYCMFAEYNPVRKILWLGSGYNGVRQHARMTADFNIAPLTEAPFSLNITDALHSVDPISGKQIVLNRETDEWWEFDIEADNWTQIDNMVNKPSFGESVFHVPIYEYGVIMVFRQGSPNTVYLYKHSSGSTDMEVPSPSNLRVVP